MNSVFYQRYKLSSFSLSRDMLLSIIFDVIFSYPFVWHGLLAFIWMSWATGCSLVVIRFISVSQFFESHLGV